MVPQIEKPIKPIEPPTPPTTTEARKSITASKITTSTIIDTSTTTTDHNDREREKKLLQCQIDNWKLAYEMSEYGYRGLKKKFQTLKKENEYLRKKMKNKRYAMIIDDNNKENDVDVVDDDDEMHAGTLAFQKVKAALAALALEAQELSQTSCKKDEKSSADNGYRKSCKDYLEDGNETDCSCEGTTQQNTEHKTDNAIHTKMSWGRDVEDEEGNSENTSREMINQYGDDEDNQEEDTETDTTGGCYEDYRRVEDEEKYCSSDTSLNDADSGCFIDLMYLRSSSSASTCS